MWISQRGALLAFLNVLPGIVVGCASHPASQRQLAAAPSTMTLEKLDSIVAQARDLEDFLGQPKIVGSYGLALEDYFDPSHSKKHFSQERYHLILDQLREILPKVPGLAQRLWETNVLGAAFSIDNEESLRGISLNPIIWSVRLQDWNYKLGVIEQDFQSKTHLNKYIPADWGAVLNRIEDEHKVFEKNLALQNLSIRNTHLARGQFLAKQKDALEVIHIASFLLQAYLHDDEFWKMSTDQEEVMDPNVLLSKLEDLKKDPDQLIDVLVESGHYDGNLPRPKALKALLADLILNPAELRKNARIFPMVELSGAPVGTYNFVPPPRRLHGIWKSTLIYDCLAGDCPRSLTPQRWASVAIKDSQLHFVQLNGKYLGFTQVVPGKVKKIYGSYELGAPVLGKEVVQFRNGMRIKKTMFEFALVEQLARIPSEWSGLVMGEVPYFGNNEARDVAYKSSAFLFGESVGKGGLTFQLLDPMTKDIVDSVPAQKWARGHAGNMVTEGSIRGAGDLILLNPNPTQSLATLIHDPSWVSQQLKTGEPMKKRASLLAILSERNPQDPKIWATVFSEISKWNEDERSEFGHRIYYGSFNQAVEQFLPEEHHAAFRAATGQACGESARTLLSARAPI